MSKPPKRKRRWFQFSLRTLLIGVTLLAVACAYVGWQAKIVRERRAELNRASKCGWSESPAPMNRASSVVGREETLSS